MKPVSRNARRQPRGHHADEASRAELAALLGDPPRRRDLLIERLHRIQDRLGHIPARLLVALAESLDLAPVEVYEVATFYHHFNVVREEEKSPPLTVRVCDSICCALDGAEELIEALEQAAAGGAAPAFRIQRVSCIGRCNNAPAAVVGPHVVGHATPAAIDRAIVNNRTTAAIRPVPVDYEAYRLGGGYHLVSALEAADERVLAEIVDKVDAAGLRGLGGAGFPAARKWRIVRQQPAPRLMAVNIDEGEPGTFKDRHHLERDPHRILEGMLIAARVVDAEAVYIYLRDEYPHCRRVLERELEALRTDPPAALPRIELRRGAGAYICGEESAMLESIEGKRGLPRLRPPYVAERGLFGRPTLVHNLETLWWLRDIIENGPQTLSSQGRHGRIGLRSFSLSGRVRKPGVYLAPAGITARELIEEYGGGMRDGHRLKAYFPGGVSGGILPARLADIPLDFDSLHEHGCFIGSAAVIVLSDHDSVRDAALNAMRFFARESCGQCTPCRSGTDRAVRLMSRPSWDSDLLGELAQVMADASICGLGQAAPNPLMCALRYFPEECAG